MMNIKWPTIFSQFLNLYCLTHLIISDGDNIIMNYNIMNNKMNNYNEWMPYLTYDDDDDDDDDSSCICLFVCINFYCINLLSFSCCFLGVLFNYCKQIDIF